MFLSGLMIDLIKISNHKKKEGVGIKVMLTAATFNFKRIDEQVRTKKLSRTI